MSCECYQIGGRFIAEDPDCPAHGRESKIGIIYQMQGRDERWRDITQDEYERETQFPVRRLKLLD